MANHGHEKRRKKEAERILKDVDREGDIFGRGAYRLADKAKTHFSGADAEGNDKIEIWGRRIGRALSLIVFIGLLIYVIRVYG